MKTFLDARVTHIFQHLNGTTGPHTVCLPQKFDETADQFDVEHWLVDYQYLHRLLRMFPGLVTPDYADKLEQAFSDAMRPQNWPWTQIKRSDSLFKEIIDTNMQRIDTKTNISMLSKLTVKLRVKKHEITSTYAQKDPDLKTY